MGAKDSKPSCISYEDAIKRVSDGELKRIREAFKRSAGAGNSSLSKGAFVNDVLGDGVPSVVADWLYTTCGGTAKGIQFKELICGLVLLTKGTFDEKIKFLWNLYCNESGTHILKIDFQKALQSELIYQASNRLLNNSTGNNNSQSTNSILISLFGQSDRVTFDQFRAWITFNKQATVLSKWLLLEPYVHLSSDLETPTFFQSLAGVTHLEEQDIRDLERVFCRLKGQTVNDQLDIESMGPLLSPPIPKNAVSGVFNAFDENRDGHIDFKELCCGVSAACRGPDVERSKFCFKVFDTDRDGLLNLTEINEMIDVLIYVAKDSTNSHNSLTREVVLEDLKEFVLKHNTQQQSKENDDDKQSEDEFSLSQETFLMWSVIGPLNLIQQFRNLLFDVCHIVLGLRPECRHIEHAIVKGWMSREERRGYKVGQFWYLISSEWWQNWLQYTLNEQQPNCSHCKGSAMSLTTTTTSTTNNNNGNNNGTANVNNYNAGQTINIHVNNGSSSVNCNNNSTAMVLNGRNGGAMVDEAIICDESFTSNSTESMGMEAAETSSLGSTSSGISSFGRQSANNGNANGILVHGPGTIDNRSLVELNLYKNVQTLTGEGGRLKKNTPLVQHRDFELVPDSLWRALSLWYNGPLPLPRQVIQSDNSPEVELELYPLNLRIFRHQNPQPISNQLTNGGSAINSAWGAVGGAYGALTNTGTYTATSSVQQALQPPKKYFAYVAAFSKLATIRQVGEFLCHRLKLKTEDIRIWHMNAIPCLLEEEQMTLEELMINDNDQILLEVRNKDLTWPEELGSLSTLTTNGSGNLNYERRPTVDSLASTHPPGATGLHNLGNTCFMNSALQVMFNTQPLSQYFLQNMHLFELNTMNKLGTKGQLALRYSELLKEVWTASTRSVAPLKLRFCVTKHAPQFAGGGQHDSQELLAWLLDCLHEDLNRVTEKPYSELKDSDGRADSVVAMEAWTQHNARNQSIVIDLFYGQLKSKVSCLACGHDSVRFDPFSVLNLPLPVENYTYCEVLLILLDGSVPVKYGIRMNSESKYCDLKRELSTICANVEPELMLCCEVSDAQIKFILPDDQKIKPLTATELYVYELPKGGCCDRPRTSSELGVNIEKGLKDIQRNPALRMANDQQLTTSSNSINIVPHVPKEVEHGGQHMVNGDLQADEDYVAASHRANNRRTSKVSRCFGNSLCMPQTLLCFKNDEISTSPENSFIDTRLRNCSPNRRTVAAKAISSSNLLSGVDNYSLSSLEESGPANKLKTISSKEEEGSTEDLPESCIRSQRACIYKTAAYLVAVHRQLSRQDTYFLPYHKAKPNLFGVPLLIPCYDGGTNKDLYCAVWIQVARFLSPLPPTPPDQANHATDCDDSLGYEFPFTLKAVGEGGRVCAFCPWSKFCRGCEIPCNDEPLLQGVVTSAPDMNYSAASTPILSNHRREQLTKNGSSDVNLHRTMGGNNQHRRTQSEQIDFKSGRGQAQANPVSLNAITIAIDWDPTALYLRYQSTREKMWTEHESVAIFRRQQTEPVDLDHCLRAFTSEEKLEQWYHCSHCNSKKPATKKLQIWKLPPVLIIHLKRFNMVNNKWVKSQKVVNFPFEQFDPTPYLASVPQETILRHKELKSLELESPNRNCDINEVDEGEDDVSESLDENGESVAKVEENVERVEKEVAKGKDCDTKKMHNLNKNTTLERRKRLISASLTKTPVIDGEFIDFHKHRLKDGQDEFDLKYRLYAVVSHSGMLNGGHYISYASNPNGSWYCYNDSSCKEIPQRPNIDPGSAYLLFYERQGLDYGPYLPKVEGRTIPNGNLNELLNTDSDNDLKKMCVIS